MRRRDLLKAAAAATLTASVAPRLGRGADRTKTLVFVGVGCWDPEKSLSDNGS